MDRGDRRAEDREADRLGDRRPALAGSTLEFRLEDIAELPFGMSSTSIAGYFFVGHAESGQAENPDVLVYGDKFELSDEISRCILLDDKTTCF
jgi:hypothetical protein